MLEEDKNAKNCSNFIFVKVQGPNIQNLAIHLFSCH